jgi:hypothetical protein
VTRVIHALTAFFTAPDALQPVSVAPGMPLFDNLGTLLWLYRLAFSTHLNLLFDPNFQMTQMFGFRATRFACSGLPLFFCDLQECQGIL